MTQPSTTTDADLFCPQCTYNLRGIDSGRCPECGTAIDRAALAVSRIPWVHRREIGRVRAYLRTLWMATFHPKQIARDMACPVNYQDGRRFAYVTITLAVVLVAPAVFLLKEKLIVSETDGAGNPAIGANPLALIAALQDHWWGGALDLVLISMLLLTAQRLVQIFFRPARLTVIQQNRAAALSQYGIAPLLWVVIWWVGIFLGAFLDVWLQAKYYQDLPFVIITLMSISIWVLVLWWVGSFTLLLYRTTHWRYGLGRVVALLMGWPIFWGLGTLLASAILWACGFLAIVLRSLFR